MKYLALLFLLIGCSNETRQTHPLVVDYVGVLCQSFSIHLYTCNCILKDLEQDKTEEEIIQLVTKTFKKKISTEESRYLTGSIYHCQLLNSVNSMRLLDIEGEQL